MGTKLAPALDTTHLALVEETYLDNSNIPLPLYMYLRYIHVDDVFML